MLRLILHVWKASKAWELLWNQYKMMNPMRILNLGNKLESKLLADGEVIDLFLMRIKGL